MTKVAKLMAEDLDVAVLKVKLRRALEVLHRGGSTRKRELHVSDFTASDKQFCYRRLIRHYFKGKEGGSQSVSWVQYDGKFREEKWKRLLETAGIMKDYQLELRLGPLVGHPDFHIDYGKGACILELTGHDSKLDPILRNARVAQKKRQCLAYVIMFVHSRPDLKFHRGFVVVEDKGNNEFTIYPVDYDVGKAKLFVARVVQTKRFIKEMDDEKTPDDRVVAWLKIPKCESARCGTCNEKKGGG